MNEQGPSFHISRSGAPQMLAAFAVSSCCAFLQAVAAQPTPEQVSAAARDWLQGDRCLDRRMGTEIESVRTLEGADGAACHVAAVKGGGFVVLESDVEDNPVIAVSSQGRVEADERNPLWALLRRDMAARARAKTERRRKRLSASGGQAAIADVRVAALVKSAWSQQDYRNYGMTSESDICYNYYTPNHWPCGCVATAGAQLMRYHSYPAAPVEPGTYACMQGEAPVFMTMHGGTYDWNAMTLVPAKGCSTASRRAIGRLTYDVGVSVGMRYGSGFSGAPGYMLSKRLVDRFQYANAASVIFDDEFFHDGECSYTLDRFKAAVIPNFDAGLPVVLEVHGEGGHVLIGDGYGYSGGEFFIHINLGWANKDDGNVWYRPPSIDRYTSIDGVVYNVYPTGDAGCSLVSGRVLTLEGQPVKGASVRVAGGGSAAETVSGDKGIYALRAWPGECWIVAEKDGRAVSNRVTVTKCVSLHIDESGYYWNDVRPQIGNLCNVDLSFDVALQTPADDMPVDVSDVQPTGAFAAPEAVTANGVVVKDGKAFGVLQVKVGRASRSGESKVSATVFGIDGRKYTAKAVKIPVGDTVTRDFDVKTLGKLTLTFGANGFSGSLAGMDVTSVKGTAATTPGKANVLAVDLSSLAGALTDYLPTDVTVTRTAKKWTVAEKAGKLKYVKDNPGKGVVAHFDEGTGRNLAALKLTYAPKTQTFKGSFKIWTFDGTKGRLKSVPAKVTGVVVNGEGYGEVSVKKTKIGELAVR